MNAVARHAFEISREVFCFYDYFVRELIPSAGFSACSSAECICRLKEISCLGVGVCVCVKMVLAKNALTNDIRDSAMVVTTTSKELSE